MGMTEYPDPVSSDIRYSYMYLQALRNYIKPPLTAFFVPPFLSSAPCFLSFPSLSLMSESHLYFSHCITLQ